MIKAIDFFCGGGGMTYGLKQAGIDVIAGIDIDSKCKETYEFNNKPAKFIEENIADFDINSLEKGYVIDDNNEIKIRRNDDNLMFAGCSPCQFWSVMNTDKTKAKQSKNLLDDFREFVNYYNPGYVLIENVPGIFSHNDSPLKKFIIFLQEKNYFSLDHKVIRVDNYGVPQTRKRFILVASRVKDVSVPDPDDTIDVTVRHFIGDYNAFPKIKAGNKDTTDFCHRTAGLSETNLKRLALTSADGGTREAWADTNLQLSVYKKNRKNKKFGFKDVYGRMYWDKPAPTITTKFYSLSNGRFGHPEQDRALSLREGATLQTFPLDYIFKLGTITDISRIIGNAVPPELAKRIGKSILQAKIKHKTSGIAGR